MNPDEYLKMAKVEDRMWYYRALHAHLRSLLRKFLDESSEARVLDAGCGTGGFIRRMESESTTWRICGVDHSPLACGIARERCAAEIKEGSVTALPYESGEFDGMVSADVLYQLEQPEQALVEFHRCLKPGGIVVINVPAYRWLWSYHDEMVQSKHRFRRSELVGMMTAAGFKVEVSTYWNTLLFPLVVLRRKLFPPGKDGDVRIYPAPVEAVFNALMICERWWLNYLTLLPFGSSVLIAARCVK